MGRAPRRPEGPPPPPAVARLRIRYAKRGRLRFSSHRDLARALERALRRARVPMAYSAGFSPHPKISYLGAAPTGVASEAEYLEIGVTEHIDPEVLRAQLDEALPDGLDVVEIVLAGDGRGGLAERVDASQWRIELPGVAPDRAAAAIAAFEERDQVLVTRLTKGGRREIDVRAAVHSARVRGAEPSGYAILNLVIRHGTPAVRPDDVLTGLRYAADLELPESPRATRIAQGSLDPAGRVTDPFDVDRRMSLGVPS